jgi:hypothetical protein
MPARPDILTRPTNGVPCGVLTDVAKPRSDKNNKGSRAGDLWYYLPLKLKIMEEFISMANMESSLRGPRI